MAAMGHHKTVGHFYFLMLTDLLLFFTSKLHMPGICCIGRDFLKNFQKIQFSDYPTSCEYSWYRIKEHHGES